MHDRTPHTFTGWLQNGTDVVSLFLADIQSKGLDEEDMTEDTRGEIEHHCKRICSLIDLARNEVLEREVERAEEAMLGPEYSADIAYAGDV